MFNSYRTASAVPELIPGNVQYNVSKILDLCREAAAHGAGLVVFPELCISGASCGDLFGSSHLLSHVMQGIKEIKKFTSGCDCAVIAGFPLLHRGKLYDCSAVFHHGSIAGICGKYSVSNPLFTSFAGFDGSTVNFDGENIPCGKDLIFETAELRFGVCVGDDLLAPGTPAELLCVHGAHLILNPCCSGEFAAESRAREEQIKVFSSRVLGTVVSAGAGVGESGTDMICGGRAVIFNNGTRQAANIPLSAKSDIIYADILPEMTEFRRIREKIADVFVAEQNVRFVALGAIPFSPDWQELHLERNPFVPEDRAELDLRCREITGLETCALSGGVFQNTLLLELVLHELEQNGFNILRHRLVPPNDGGIALGQAAVAMYQLNKKD